MDEIEQRIVEGEEANRLMSNPVLLKALSQIKADCTARIVSSSPSDKEGRENAYHLLKATECLEINLQAMKTKGAIEKQKVEKSDRRRKGVKK